jgi:hypothetical protein
VALSSRLDHHTVHLTRRRLALASNTLSIAPTAAGRCIGALLGDIV